MAWQKEFKKISLNDYKGRYLCLFFYPLDFTFVCPTEIIEFNNHAPSFAKLNCGLVGCSIDSHFTHMEYTQKPREKGGLGALDFPLLSDVTKKISRDYGVLLEDEGIALRGTFIIDGSGVLRHAGINDLPVGRNVEEVVRLVEAFQYTDKHGEVCPASWKQGQATMEPTHESGKTQDYWAKVHSKK
eukprot:CAMPEP_0114591614 /NCGR_PEP_ID=MMETSP0125-20121206/13618_1 /TAXON_ID=485358 ORGANISM="Aristerostoma sp., Strain ATCC 50986" /NCGR_SAMPLE_ID=MMETSP0125 /ASSEMBLY_ACC=CAM_ASM_000245 /LENGTH=185 /DNA_ID=CAMNT_0001789789 /DNA_START=98 /DNA_END=655 /DNA_ORIENTATION=+